MSIWDDPRDSANWPGLKFNPAMGDLHTIESLAYDVKTVGNELDELRDMLTGIGRTDGVWEGDAARNFQDKVGELPKYLKQGHESMTACAKALQTWHTQLQAMQRQAKGLEEQAVEARHRVERSNDAVERYNSKLGPANQAATRGELTDVDRQRLQDEGEAVESAAQHASDDLESILDKAKALQDYWEEQAGKAEDAIRKAAENRPPDISVWDKITGGLKGAWDGFKDFLIDNADLFSTISSALAAAAIVVNVIPVGGQVASAILGAGSVAFAGAAMAGHWMGGAPPWKVGLDALGVIPGVGGTAKGLISGVKAVRAGGKFASGIAQGGKAMMGMMKNPFSTKMINKGLGLFGKSTAPEVITTGVKGFSTGFGTGHLLFGGGEGEGGGAGAATQAHATSTPANSATADRFHHTLAA